MTEETSEWLASRRGFDPNVYEPAEDSQLLLARCRADIDAAERVLEVGTGSGYVAAGLAEETGATISGVDINPYACRRTKEAGIEVIRGTLTSAFRAGHFDVVVFNPPYLPSEGASSETDWFARAVDGGPGGLAVTVAFLEDLPRVLASDGRGYLLVSSLMARDRLHRTVQSTDFHRHILGEPVHYGDETLAVWRLDRCE